MHQAISTVKFKALARRLGMPTYRVVGVLESLWLFAQIQARDGDLSRFTSLELAGWLEWDGGDDDGLIDALVETRWLDRNGDSLSIHDWDEHKPNYLKGADAAAAKRRPPKDGSKAPSRDAPKDGSRVTPKDGSKTPPPNLTKPITKPTSAAASAALSAEPPDSSADPPFEDAFVAAWNAAPGVCVCRELNAKRRTALRSRLKTRVETDVGPQPWFEAFQHAIATRFPLRCTRGDPDGWRPDADFILRPDSLSKIFEGKYDWSKTDGRSSESRIGAGQRFIPEVAGVPAPSGDPADDGF